MSAIDITTAMSRRTESDEQRELINRIARASERMTRLIVLRDGRDEALKFTPRDGVITVSASRVSDEVRISVSDTGSGIPEAERVWAEAAAGGGACLAFTLLAWPVAEDHQARALH